MGGPHRRASATRLLRKRASRCDGGGFARHVRDLLWYDRRPSLRVGGCRRSLGADRARSSAGALGRGADAGMIRVVLPAHLRTLARVEGEVHVELDGEATQRRLLDALELRFPALRGT